MLFDPKKDYCTKSPDKILNSSIKKCCFEHDKNYANQIGKFKADFKLFKCILFKRKLLTGFIYFSFVSLFGHKYYKGSNEIKENKKDNG